jgi:hypothetical protein
MTIARGDEIHVGTQSATVKFAKIDTATSGNNTIVAAVSGRKIRVVAACVHAAGNVTVKFQSGASGTDLTGAMTVTATGPIQLMYCQFGHFETAAGSLLNMVLGGVVQVSGWVAYVEV